MLPHTMKMIGMYRLPVVFYVICGVFHFICLLYFSTQRHSPLSLQQKKNHFMCSIKAVSFSNKMGFLVKLLQLCKFFRFTFSFPWKSELRKTWSIFDCISLFFLPSPIYTHSPNELNTIVVLAIVRLQCNLLAHVIVEFLIKIVLTQLYNDKNSSDILSFEHYYSTQNSARASAKECFIFVYCEYMWVCVNMVVRSMRFQITMYIFGSGNLHVLFYFDALLIR